MQSSHRARQQGIAHLGLMLALAIVLGAVGFAGYRVFAGKKPTADTVVGKAARVAAEKACTETDKNVCKFMASWKLQKYYTVKSTMTGENENIESIYKADGDKKFHISTTGSNAFEMISIDKDTYTKAADGTWWKSTAQSEETKKYADNFTYKDSEETSNSENPTDKTTYKSLGKEACGNLTCFKYQVLNSSTPNDKEYIWFDDNDYQLRRNRTEVKDGGTTDSTFSYDKVTISVPSPVKELGPNQYLMPGASEPTTLPDAGSYQDYLNSLPQGAPDAGSET
jgi:hypothetical protein